MVHEKNPADELRSQIVTVLPSVWRFALSLAGRPDMADDLTQATCVRALEKAHQWRRDNRLSGWLLTICRSIWLNELRAEAVRRTGSLDTAAPSELIDSACGVELRTFASQVCAKILDLPEAQRAAVELVYVQQFTYSEAASILNVPIGTIMSRLATARAALADLREDAATSWKATRQ